MAQGTDSKAANPAAGLLIMAGANVVAAIGFIVFYFLHRGANGEGSYWLLIAAMVFFVATVGLIVVYNVFKRKLSGLSTPPPTDRRRDG
ncbi:MAG TPA: hypothetical protein VNA88_08810 [Candidatus Kapabacteria bacterium]|nr:hypothetical protein [Candidatus Kapabacteria bacterium]